MLILTKNICISILKIKYNNKLIVINYTINNVLILTEKEKNYIISTLKIKNIW